MVTPVRLVLLKLPLRTFFGLSIITIITIVVIIVPASIVFYIIGRILYWTATLVPIWIYPDYHGRLHRWPLWVNGMVCLSLFGLVYVALIPRVDDIARWYVGRVLDLSLPTIAATTTWIAKVFGIDGCGSVFGATGGCEIAIRVSLTEGPLPQVFLGVALALAMTVLFIRVTTDARRLRDIDADNG